MPTADITNTDTLGYQVHNTNFASELKKVARCGQDVANIVALVTALTKYIPAQMLTSPPAELQYHISDQFSLDGNTVGMDRERT